FNAANIKAYFRAAKAANALEKYEEALHWCQLGLEVTIILFYIYMCDLNSFIHSFILARTGEHNDCTRNEKGAKYSLQSGRENTERNGKGKCIKARNRRII